MQTDFIIQARQLTRTFGILKAVDQLELNIRAGELYGFLGPNGAGKTTTIRMLIGLLRPTAGSASVAGYDVVEQPMQVKSLTGYLPEEPYLYEKLTGWEYLRFIGGLYGLPDERCEQRAAELLKTFGLLEKTGDLIESYSHGMRKRIALSAALIHEPRFLLLDEPFNGLDPRHARRVKDILRDLCSQGTTILLSTHTLEIAERLCDRVGILNHGRLIAEGTMAELRSQAKQTASERMPLEEPSVSQATLEDLFIRLTGGEEIAEVAGMLDE